MFKKGDISRNEVSMCIRRIAKVPTLKAGITKENALRGLSRKFILAKSKYVDKTSASENTQRETNKGLIRKDNRMRNLITHNRRGHTIDQIAGYKNKVPPKNVEELYGGGEKCELSQLSDDFFVECKHKNTDEESHGMIKTQRKGQRGIPRHYHCLRCKIEVLN